MNKPKTVRAIVAAGVTAGAAIATLSLPTTATTQAGPAQPYGGVRVVRP